MTKLSLAQKIRFEMRPARLMVNLVAGFIIGVLIIIVEISFGALIFSGDLSAFVFQGVGLVLFGSAAIGIVVALTSSYPATIARPHEIPAAVLAIVAAGIASRLAGSPGPEVFTTVVGAIVLTSLLTGLFFLCLGIFRLGTLVRFIPYPVVGGFLAGTGWLLIKGGLNVMTNVKMSVSTAHQFLHPDLLPKWLAGLGFALVLLLVTRRFKHFAVMPGLILAGVLVFYAVLLAGGVSVREAQAAGWLLGPFQQGSMWKPLSPGLLLDVKWSLVFAQMGNLGTILLISVIPLLLNASGFELVVRRDIDFNRELKSAGVANIVAALGGGTVGLHSLSLCALGYRMGANSRVAGLVAGGMCGATLIVGSSLLTYLPKPILGALLLYLGLGFLVEWVVESWHKLPRVDYGLVVFILVIIGAFGFLQGVGVGILIAVVLFVVNYARTRVVKYALTGAHFHSNVDRSPEERKVLSECGDRLHILKLQGFVFFGTANDLLNQVRQRAEGASLPALEYVILDFHLVTGLDSSGVSSFTKLKQVAAGKRFTLVFTGLSPVIVRQLERGGFLEHDKQPLVTFADLDHGVEWCEDRILEGQGVAREKTHTLADLLASVLPEGDSQSRLVSYLERREADAGAHLMRQGDPPQCLYFIESGRVTVELEAGEGKRVRLRTMGAGTVVGEMGIYMGTPASASVVAAEKTVMYRLCADSLRSMEEKDPDVAAAFHKFIARLLAERLTKTNRALQAVLD